MNGTKCRSHTVSQVALAQTYLDHTPLLHRFANRFHLQYGGQYDDWLGECDVAFINAYNNYNWNRSIKFSTWLWHSINYHLREVVRRQAKHADVTMHPLEEDCCLYQRPSTLHDRVHNHACQCAKEIYKLIADPPSHLQWFMKHKDPEVVWDCIRQHMHYHCNWPLAHISSALGELRELCFED